MNRPLCPIGTCRRDHPQFDVTRGDRAPATWERAVEIAIALGKQDKRKRRVAWHNGMFVRTWVVQVVES